MTKPDRVLKPNAVIGILGGGQLGRMLCTAATQLGFKTHVYCPDENAPAFDCASTFTVGDYEDVTT